MRIGILALQGDYEAHGRMLEQLQVEYIFIRKPQHLYTVDGLIIPGGESTSMLKFLNESNFADFLKTLGSIGKPIFGTCAGAILLATQVLNPEQTSLGLIDVTIERNGYGRQVASSIVTTYCELSAGEIELVFIRAPRIRRLGPKVKTLIQYENEPVCVQEKNCLIATFHPELTNDTTLHKYFLNLCDQQYPL